MNRHIKRTIIAIFCISILIQGFATITFLNNMMDVPGKFMNIRPGNDGKHQNNQ